MYIYTCMFIYKETINIAVKPETNGSVKYFLFLQHIFIADQTQKKKRKRKKYNHLCRTPTPVWSNDARHTMWLSIFPKALIPKINMQLDNTGFKYCDNYIITQAFACSQDPVVPWELYGCWVKMVLGYAKWTNDLTRSQDDATAWLGSQGKLIVCRWTPQG